MERMARMERKKDILEGKTAQSEIRRESLCSWKAANRSDSLVFALGN